MFSPTDTIVAIATPGGRGGIGVVRISGPRAADIARAILTTPRELRPRYATHTFVRPGQMPSGAVEGAGDEARPWREARDYPAGPSSLDATPGSGSARAIDEVVATLFPAPHSYTTEDVVEISAHGSPAVLRGSYVPRSVRARAWPSPGNPPFAHIWAAASTWCRPRRLVILSMP